MDLVSAVISTYNRSELLVGRSLHSVRHQTYTNLEIIVVGDGTDEQTVEAMREVCLVDPRVSFTNLPRQVYPQDPGAKWCVLGLEARNYGFDQASGDWVAPLDDDDEWTPDHVEVLLARAKERNADFAYGVSSYHWPDGRFQTAGRWPPGYGAFCDGAQVYRNGMGYRFDPACIERGLPEDGDMWERMVAGGVSFTFLPRLVHHYYVNPR